MTIERMLGQQKFNYFLTGHTKPPSFLVLGCSIPTGYSWICEPASALLVNKLFQPGFHISTLSSSSNRM